MILPIEPVPTRIQAKYLYNLDSTKAHTESGSIIALEFYADTESTFAFEQYGAVFHDLPLYASSSISYYKSLPEAIPEVVEFSHTFAMLFDENREFMTKSRYLLSLNYPEHNELVHLCWTNTGLYIWPNHKVIFDDNCPKLPDWKKKRY